MVVTGPRSAQAWLRRAGWLALGGLACASLLWGLGSAGPEPEPEPELEPVVRMPVTPPATPATELVPDVVQHRLALPAGGAPRCTCTDARRVAAFLAHELAAPPIPPTPRELAERWNGLLDPHGLWSAAPDSPLGSELTAVAADALSELQASAGGCAFAERVAHTWLQWLAELAPLYDHAFESARTEPRSRGALFELAAEPIFQDDPVTRPGRELTRELGRRLGAFAASFPGEVALIDEARVRYLPSGAVALSEMATLALLRAYVPLLDPHGDFAPLDEEWALYAGDSTLDAGSPLWADATRTPLGARVVADAAPPLQVDDLVLSINGFTLAGASVDQIEQAARTSDEQGTIAVRVLRKGEPELLSFRIEAEVSPPVDGLEVERIRYGRGDQVVLRVRALDVADDLAEQLEQVLERERSGSGAVLLDLRGNGGGSLDAAVEALGLLLPGAPLFPLIHRGLVSEVLRAPRGGPTYTGPVAALVDGDTASAAEMLAGALQAYERGTVIGARTFGKGCVQEYFEGVVPSGVLRMTTLQFVLPDGRPLQQIGLSPELTLPLPPALERESHITRQPISFDGPDVRDRSIPAGPSWPRDSAAAGPCRDPVVCLAIARLAGAATPRLRSAKTRAGTR